MARLTVLPALAALVLVTLVLSTGAAATTRPPTLTLVGRLPTIVVHGTGFHPRERVAVTAGLRTIHLRTTRLGSFVVHTGLTASRCTASIIRAVGIRGDVALLKLPVPACMPARLPG